MSGLGSGPALRPPAAAGGMPRHRHRPRRSHRNGGAEGHVGRGPSRAGAAGHGEDQHRTFGRRCRCGRLGEVHVGPATSKLDMLR